MGIILYFLPYSWVYNVTLICSQKNNTKANGVDFLTSIKSGSGWGDWHISRTPRTSSFLCLNPIGGTGTPAGWLMGRVEGRNYSWVKKNFTISKNMLLDLLWVGLRVLVLIELKVSVFMTTFNRQRNWGSEKLSN